jgi:serine/threonine protein kinase
MEESSPVNMLTIDRAKILGKGKYGIVYKGVWGENPQIVAIKRIPIDNVATSNEREVNALKKFDHENVIKLLHVEEDKDFKYYLVWNYN